MAYQVQGVTDTDRIDHPRFSIVIPTYQRRDVVIASIRALEHQDFKGGFEVIVVVDGSTDDSAQALQKLNLNFPFKVIEQSNRGAAAARNRGADCAIGDIILFLDDDMEADPQMLSEHDRSHREGADVVIGDIPLHPQSPSNFLSEGIKKWAEKRRQYLSSSDAKLGFRDILTGQLSIARSTFDKQKGFDTQFTQDGFFGNEDVDFGYRLVKEHFKIVFNPDAVSRQRYVVTPRQYLKQYRQAGYSAVALARKHPEQINQVFPSNRRETNIDRYLGRWIRPVVRLFVLTMIDLGFENKKTLKLFQWVRKLEWCRGVREGGGIPENRP
jgi:glycosyltransferase involved in cell wall biosynthesis